MKFVHAADIHLDSPLRGLERYEGAPVDELRGATRRAFENLVDLAIEDEVAFVLLAGDLYDGDWKDYNTGQRTSTFFQPAIPNPLSWRNWGSLCTARDSQPVR